MTTKKELLVSEKYYHIYNRGIDSCHLFKEDTNYEHFLKLYDKYIDPIADTFAWVLMNNHFHLLVKIKPEEQIKVNLEGLDDIQNLDVDKRIYQQFSNLFNAYTKSFNKRYERTGSLFESNFRRLLVDDEDYFRTLVVYIHNNPVHHGVCEHILDYPWSSYLSCISIKSTKLQNETVSGWFDNIANFKQYHNTKARIGDLENLLEF